jgi:transitional endoplasmic reticulum ATPase
MFIAEETTILTKRGKPHAAATLTPAQNAAASELLKSLSLGGAFALRAASGMGRTTVLKHVQSTVGGALLGMRQFIDMLMVRRPDAIEQAFVEMLEEALLAHQVVLVDDLHLLTAITDSFNYGRTGLLNAALEAILSGAIAAGRKLVFGLWTGYAPSAIWAHARLTRMGEFTPSDYASVVRAYLGDHAETLDLTRIHRAAPALNAHQLSRAAIHFVRAGRPTTDDFIGYLAQHDLSSNVELGEVQAVDWNDLKGIDDVIEALEAKIALPFENGGLAAELNLKPKRGVLLAGPPGTGKTTIGRALAHRLKGKFFLIDGTVIAGSGDFHDDVSGIFENAKKNAPSVIFIDDSDVIFEDHSKGFYRYLLTMLDGLESASAERVCVMMTAMNVGSLPEALLRSGRIELWLETRLPDENARRSILREKLSKLPEPIASANIAVLAAASRHLTGADIKAVIEDGKLAFARARDKQRPARPVEQYFLEAIEVVLENRRRYARSKPPKMTDTVGFGFAPKTAS